MRSKQAISIIGLSCLFSMVLSSCSNEKRDPEATAKIYSELSVFCDDLDYSVLEQELGPEENIDTIIDHEGSIANAQDFQALTCADRSFLNEDLSTAGRISIRVSLNESDPYGIDISEEEATDWGEWRNFSAVFPGRHEKGQGTDGSHASLDETLVGKGEFPDESWDRVTFVHYSAGNAGQIWDPQGTGAAIFAWFEHSNLRVQFRLGVDADLYSTAPETETLLAYLSEVAESVRAHLEYGESA